MDLIINVKDFYWVKNIFFGKFIFLCYFYLIFVYDVVLKWYKFFFLILRLKDCKIYY